MYPYNQPEELEIQTNRAGCGFFFLLPPLAVVVLSIILFYTLNSIRNPEIAASLGAMVSAQSQPEVDPGRLAPFFSPSVLFWAEDIERWAAEYNLDPNLVATVMQIESCGHPTIQSNVGATGLFQVMPFHFKGDENPTDPETNAKRGMGYLVASLKDKNGDIRLGLAGYNGGIAGSRRPESEWPAETIRYVYWGTGIYEDALVNNATSERLAEWYSKGGASLCRQAENYLNLAP